jgi:hypothetical protein
MSALGALSHHVDDTAEIRVSVHMCNLRVLLGNVE